MERRRRRRRRRGHDSSNSPKPLSIDMLKKKRRRHSKGKRVSSVRLDLDNPGGYSSSGFNTAQLFWKIAAVVLVLGAISAVISDYGWAKLGAQFNNFAQGVGKGAQQTISEMKDPRPSGADNAFNEVAQIQGEPLTGDTDVTSNFYPNGKPNALSRIKLALETSNVGLTSQAILLVDEATVIDPNVTGIDLLKGTIYAQAEKIDKAREFFLRAMEQKETRYLANLDLGKLEVLHGNYSEAIPYLAEARKLNPSNRNIASLLCYALRMNHQFQEGYFEAQAAAKLDPNIRYLEVITALAAIQAGSYQPPTSILSIIDKAEIETSASPYDLVIAAGVEQSRGNSDRVKAYWNVIRPHSVTMLSLKELEKDPLFILPVPQTPAQTALIEKPHPAADKMPTVSSLATDLPEDIPALEFDLNISMEDQKNLDSGFLNLNSDLPTTP